MKKPANIIYGILHDSPPPIVTALNGVQHVGLIAINLVYPLLIFRMADAPVDLISNMLAIGMLVLGVATLLQATNFGPIGSGYMCPATFTATYLPFAARRKSWWSAAGVRDDNHCRSAGSRDSAASQSIACNLRRRYRDW